MHLVDDGLGVGQVPRVGERGEVAPPDDAVQLPLQAALHDRELDHEEEEPPEVGRRRLGAGLKYVAVSLFSSEKEYCLQQLAENKIIVMDSSSLIV